MKWDFSELSARQTGERQWLNWLVTSIERRRCPSSARNLLGFSQMPLFSMLNRQGLHLLAEGTGGLEALHFEITFYIPFIVTVLHAVNQIPGIQAMQRIYQVATRSKSAKSKRSKERCWQRTAAFSQGLFSIQFCALPPQPYRVHSWFNICILNGDDIQQIIFKTSRWEGRKAT